MPNYYDLIQVKPSATEAEIEAAIDARYNQSRALVTHHDDTVRDQANQSLRMLEQIRATLTNPAKREVYDEAIGVKGATAGVVDPTAAINVSRTTMTPPPPPRPAPQKNAAQEESNSKLWTCQKCGEKNPEHTQFCYNCGTQLVRECPRCHRNTSLVSTGFCGNCGANYDATIERIELIKRSTEELKQLTNHHLSLTAESNALVAESKTIAERKIDPSYFGSVALLCIFGSIPLLCSGVGGIFGVFQGAGAVTLCILTFLGIAALLGGICFSYLAILRRRSANAKRDTEVKNLQDQALAKASQAKALETPMMNLQTQLKDLSS